LFLRLDGMQKQRHRSFVFREGAGDWYNYRKD
jgi:hypothetical protein